MKLKKLVQMILVAGVAIGIASCSSMGKKNDASVADANGAQSMGAGDANGFGSEGAMNPQELLAKRVYYFDFDKSEIRDEDKPAIDANAGHIASSGGVKVLLEGHTDPRGSREYNVALGERRANAVSEFLKSKGVNPDQVRVISYGAERLAENGRTESDFERDRRVVLVYLQQ